jgi:hypothetical protein
MLPYQVVFLVNQLFPVADATIAAIDMSDLQRPAEERSPLADPLEPDLFRVKRQMQSILQKLTYKHDAL